MEEYDPARNAWTRLSGRGMAKMSGFVGGVMVDKPVRLMSNCEDGDGDDGRARRGKAGEESKSKRFKLVRAMPTKLAGLIN